MNRLKLNEVRSRMTQRLIHLVESQLTTVKHLRAQIRALSPAATLERGYAIVSEKSGKIVRDESQVADGEEVLIRVNMGEFFANRTKSNK
jgi:exodeoxyribonuclease VII large subunit